MNVWDDGRSGEAGRVAGNLVLAELDKTERPIAKLKGTVFESAKALLVGRVCSSSEYLAGDVLHWANVSWDQHREVADEAKSRGKRFEYLFITASSDPPVVRFWRVPADTVATYLADRGKKSRGETCALHIVEDAGRQLLGRHDVTAFHGQVTVAGARAAELQQAIAARSAGSGRLAAPDSRAARDAPTGGYEIPLSGGRAAWLLVPAAIAPPDLDRLKGWIDLMADVLTEPDESGQQGRSRWLREQVAAGLAQLNRGETVSGEAAFARILGESPTSKRRAQRASGR